MSRKNGPNKTWRDWKLQRFVEEDSFTDFQGYLNPFILLLKVFCNMNMRFFEKESQKLCHVLYPVFLCLGRGYINLCMG